LGESMIECALLSQPVSQHNGTGTQILKKNRTSRIRLHMDSD